MPSFSSYDGTTLAYHRLGDGPPLVCLPGGPSQASRYLGDLGGLSAGRTLLLLDSRGTGDSAVPADPSSYRCDRVVEDVEAFRAHLGLDRMDLLAHSAGASVAHLYATRFAHRLRRLVLVTPSLRLLATAPVGMAEALAGRSAEPWYADATAAMDAWGEALKRGADDTEIAPLRLAAAPFLYGEWTERARAHAEAQEHDRAPAAAVGFYAGVDVDRDALRAALTEVGVPTLVVAGALDPAPTPEFAHELAELLPNAELVVLPRSGHVPFVDEPNEFAGTVERFLAD
ncbi:alpha/beta fold hydrolase [Micromonospora sp. WMMD558]|uniref:alpha/beta fold hydrolase n=1 Tax=unclassified Micromonospora TaxID=2617518 RepID=UPI0012B48223|nr:alpha/beta hydrolase [Micromonospora sp. WMMC415]QGN47515.1 alpha/beta fold hydrolase [Micromonospora sp. WMMC415]